MALFDRDNVESCEVSWAVALSDRLSECTAYQSLIERATPALALERTYLGPGPLPFDAVEFGAEEMADLFGFATIIPDGEEGQQVVESATASADDPDETSTFVIQLRRFIRPSELQGTEWRDVHNYLWDLTAKITHELYTVSNTFSETNTSACPRVRSVRRLGMGYNPFSEQSGHGAMWCAEYSVLVGETQG